MSDVLIRPYEAKDLERILELTKEGFPGVSIDYHIEMKLGYAAPGWEERKCGDIRKLIQVEPQGVFVAEAAGRVVGYVIVASAPDKSLGRITDLVVDAQMRNQGLGRRLIAKALEYIKEQGLVFAKIETLDNNAVGQALYPQFGFKEMARQIHYVMRVD
ncbi:MAG TPA: GNAT family N-acetyltransferase [Firmicutes bacterium]|jgi:ribosomal protein S18 acetylase RimI-like enzyme|nr:GNAT family N-acetyltransferase [Bacillota bacterium]